MPRKLSTRASTFSASLRSPSLDKDDWVIAGRSRSPVTSPTRSSLTIRSTATCDHREASRCPSKRTRRSSDSKYTTTDNSPPATAVLKTVTNTDWAASVWSSARSEADPKEDQSRTLGGWLLEPGYGQDRRPYVQAPRQTRTYVLFGGDKATVVGIDVAGSNDRCEQLQYCVSVDTSALCDAHSLRHGLDRRSDEHLANTPVLT